jgi:hypothetical protein
MDKTNNMATTTAAVNDGDLSSASSRQVKNEQLNNNCASSAFTYAVGAFQFGNNGGCSTTIASPLSTTTKTAISGDNRGLGATTLASSSFYDQQQHENVIKHENNSNQNNGKLFYQSSMFSF